MANLYILRNTITGELVYLSESQVEQSVGRSPVITLPDAATIAIDASQGNYFQASSPSSRNLGIPANPPPPGESQVIHFTWTKTGGGSGSLNLVTAGVGAWRIGDIPNGVSMTGTQSGKKLRFTAVYDPVDQRWDVVAFTNQL